MHVKRATTQTVAAPAEREKGDHLFYFNFYNFFLFVNKIFSIII